MAKQKTKRSRPKPINDQLTVVEYLGDILDGARQNALSIDAQINILVGFSTALFLFAISRLHHSIDDIAFMIAAVMSALSAIVALIAIHPPRFTRKRGQEESLIYNREIVTFKHSRAYAAELFKTLKDERAVAQQYAIEIYNLYRFYYRPKRQLFHLARNILLAGIILSAFAFVLILTILG